MLPTGGSGTPAAARDSQLMQQVAPLVAGNCRAFLLVTVSAAPEDYLDTINTLRVASRAQGIRV